MSGLLSILILTRNEEIHIERCLESALRISQNVYVLDSNSNDKTSEIAKRYGVQVISGEYASFADKLNWGIKNIKFPTPWVMRLDADEVLSDGFLQKIRSFLTFQNEDVSGIYVRRQLWFMGKWIRFGGMYPTHSMRIWRPKCVVCESRVLDEHMILLCGHSAIFNEDIMDIPLTGLGKWISKHNEYSTLEAQAILRCKSDQSIEIQPNIFGSKPQRTRWLKLYIFYNMPLFFRSCIYFLYRYIFRLGFLDGRVGLLFHFLHGFWYRAIIDAKIREIKDVSKSKTQ